MDGFAKTLAVIVSIIAVLFLNYWLVHYVMVYLPETPAPDWAHWTVLCHMGFSLVAGVIKAAAKAT